MNTDKIYAESIANEYSKKEDSKVAALKRLDRKAKLPSRIFAFTFGIASTLILGVGMCLAMEVLGDGSLPLLVWGIIIGLLGILGVCVNYPLFLKIEKRGKEKYANDIILLAKEIADLENE